MIEFFVSGQSIKTFSPVIAADSLNYLEAKVNFTDSQWDGCSKWLHFRQGEGAGALVYDLLLDGQDRISPEQGLNLSLGQWEVYLTGVREEARLTTVPLIITVMASGLVDAPLHELPMSVAEQLDFKATQAMLLAQRVKDMADQGEFDGADGRSFAPLGYFESLDRLEAEVTKPMPGDGYGVGSQAPYDIYSWDGVNERWINNGHIQGAEGPRGRAGITYIPQLDANGNISWSNDGGLENPVVRNITGPAGPAGEKGRDGKSPFEAAKENGYTGTEASFNQALTAFPYHNSRHLPGGPDPIVVQSGNIASAAVTADKLAPNAVAWELEAQLDTQWQGESAPYTKSLAIPGLGGRVLAELICSDDWATAMAEEEQFFKIRRMSHESGTLRLYAAQPTNLPLRLRLLCLHS